jgi:putative thioredoxin
MPDSATPYILEGTADNFDRLVIENSRKGLVLVDFWAPWVGPSQRQQGMLRELAQHYRGRFLLVTLDTDAHKVIAARFGVKSLPSLKLFRNGEVVDSAYGVQPEADYRALVERHLPRPSDAVRAAAARAWAEGEHDQAIRLLADGALADPDNLALPAMLAKLLMQLEHHEQAYKVLATMAPAAREDPQIAPLLAHLSFILAARQAPGVEDLRANLAQSPDHHEARFQLAAVSLLADDFEDALGALLEILRREPGWNGGAARRGMLAVFDILGDDHPLTRHFRTELARLL